MSDLPNIIWSGSSSGASGTEGIGRVVGRHVRAGDVIGLIGPLGAGKTQWVRGLAQGMEVSAGGVASPTFVMVHEYSPQQAGGLVLVHIDAYRLRSLEDLESIGWSVHSPAQLAELRRGAVVAVEWADRLAEILDADSLVVRLDHTGPDERSVEILGGQAWSARSEALRLELSKMSGEVVGEMSKVQGPKSKVVGEEAPSQPPPLHGVAGEGKLLPGVPGLPGGVKCSICGKAVDVSGRYGVFCSARCQQVDLGRWLGGSYVVSRELEQQDLEEEQ